MANENAVKYLQDQENKLKDKMARSIGAVYDLQKYLHLTKPPMRMECFDISHIQGSETVASMVVFQDGKPDKESYRRFKINSTEGKQMILCPCVKSQCADMAKQRQKRCRT